MKNEIDKEDIINPEDEEYADGHLMRVCLWSGAGYGLSVFYVYVRGDDAEYALNKTVAYCEDKGCEGLILDVDYVNDMVDNDFKEDFEEFVKNDGGELSGEEDDVYYDYKNQFISEWLDYVYVDATMEGASQPYYVRGENLRIENVENPIIKESEEKEDSGTDYSGFKVYMNTWKNYNEYGADLSQYGIKDGWMDIDEAIEFCDKYAEDEPFINDVDNDTGLHLEISEYDNAPTKLQELKELLDKYEELDDYDKEVVKAILEARGDDDIENAITIVEDGNFYFITDVSTNSELAQAYIDGIGGIVEAVGEDKLDYYFDEESWKRDAEGDIRYMIAENEERDVDDITDEEIEEYADMLLQDEMANAKYDHNDDFFERYFDYDAFGRDLSYDFTFVDGGAIMIY